MSDYTRVEVEFDERRYTALQREAKRLGLDISAVVYRATAAWLTEMADEGSLSFGPVADDEAATA